MIEYDIDRLSRLVISRIIPGHCERFRSPFRVKVGGTAGKPVSGNHVFQSVLKYVWQARFYSQQLLNLLDKLKFLNPLPVVFAVRTRQRHPTGNTADEKYQAGNDSYPEDESEKQGVGQKGNVLK